MRARTFAELIFQRRRHLNRLDARLFHEEVIRLLIEFIRSDIPLTPYDRNLIANTLEGYAFPPSPKKKRADRRWVEASTYRFAIKGIAEILKAEGVSKPIQKAEDEVAKIAALSVEAMKQRIKRARRGRSKRGQKP